MPGNHNFGVSYSQKDAEYFEKRGLKRHAGVWSLWALGVGAVISGHFSGWNIGLAVGGWGGMFIATVIIMVMFLGLVFSIAEMSPALPHTGGAYSFARTAMGPWGGFLTGLAENVEYVLTPAVIVFFISSYLSQIFETPMELLPVYWALAYALFVALNARGVALSFRVTVFVTLAALTSLAVFWVSAIPQFDFSGAALDIARGGGLLPGGHGPLLPSGFSGALTALPFAVSCYRAVASGGRRVARAAAGHSSRNHCRDVDADAVSVSDLVFESRRYRGGVSRARSVRRAFIGWIPGHLRR